MLTEVCNNVCTEPVLQPVTGEVLRGASANTQAGARLDIAAISSVHILTLGYSTPTDPHTIYRKHEQIKKRAYEQRIREIEHATFSSIVTGGLAREATRFYKRLASMLSAKWDQTYNSTLRWLRCRLAFSLLCSSIQAIRGARSSPRAPSSQLVRSIADSAHSSRPREVVSIKKQEYVV